MQKKKDKQKVFALFKSQYYPVKFRFLICWDLTEAL